MFEKRLLDNRCSEVKYQKPAINIPFVWNRQQEIVANTFLRHLALQDSKKGNLQAFKEKDPQPQGCQQHNRSPEDCLVLSLFCIYTVIK